MSDPVMEREPFLGKPLNGRKFGRLTVVKLVGFKRPKKHPERREAYWVCDCVCGNQQISSGHDLRSGDATSCGCRQREVVGKMFRSHGLAHKHPLYYRWCGMMARCNNAKHLSYHNYGGRGITICERWKYFPNFIEDMYPTFMEGLTLERKDTNGNYEPKNCTWATWKEQHQNRRDNNPKYF